MSRPSPRSCKSTALLKSGFRAKGRYKTLGKEEEAELLIRYRDARESLRTIIESNPLTIHCLDDAGCDDTELSGEVTGQFCILTEDELKPKAYDFSGNYDAQREELTALRAAFSDCLRKHGSSVFDASGKTKGKLRKIEKSLQQALERLELSTDAILSIAYSILDMNKNVERSQSSFIAEHEDVPCLNELEESLQVTSGYLAHLADRIVQLTYEINTVSDCFIEHCLPMVIRISGNYHRHDFQLDDLIQEGLVGVLVSLDRFDVDRGVRFKTYANYWVRQCVGRAVIDRGRKIRVPRHAMAMYSRVVKTKRYLSESDDDVSPQDISEALRVPLSAVERSLNLVQQPLSLDSAMMAHESGSMADFLTDDTAFSPEEETMFHLLSDELRTILRRLPEREEKILRMRYGIGARKQYTLRELGEVMGISRERVRQLEQQALGRIRLSDGIDQLREFLDVGSSMKSNVQCD